MKKDELELDINENIPEKKIMLGNEIRELSDIELLNRDYYQGRFASKINGETIFNWDEKKINY